MIQRAAKDIAVSKYAAALTGAGISVESGIPPFRGKGGLWEKIDPIKYASIDAFMADPADVWRVLISGMKDIMDKAKPNDGHYGLAKLSELGILKTIITQNVDSLHQMAGSEDVIEFHGTFARQRCLDCNAFADTRDIDMTEIPPRCQCGGIYRPDCILFGEAIPFQDLMRSQQISAECDLMLVIGTSATVQPAGAMPVIAKQHHALVIEINPEPTPLTRDVSDYIVQGKAGEVMRRIVKEVERIRDLQV